MDRSSEIFDIIQNDKYLKRDAISVAKLSPIEALMKYSILIRRAIHHHRKNDFTLEDMSKALILLNDHYN